MLLILTVTTVVEKISNGSTQPFVVKCDNGKNYVLKAINDHCNGHTLFNELISYRLAILLGLPIPDVKLVNLSQNIIDGNSEMDALNFNPGTAFTSEYMVGIPRISPIIISKCINLDDIPSIVLFDQFIINNDRSNNDGNFFFEKKTKRLMIIDHTHIFGGFQSWDIKQISECICNPAKIIDNLNGKQYRYFINYISGHSPFHKIQQKLIQVKEEDISGLFTDIPLEWNIDEREIEEVKKLLWHQISHTHEIYPQLKTVFTKWRGAC